MTRYNSYNIIFCTVKYIDDASQACSIRLRQALSKIDISDRPRPLEFFEHTGYILKNDDNQLQDDLNKLKVFTEENLMVIVKESKLNNI